MKKMKMRRLIRIPTFSFLNPSPEHTTRSSCVLKYRNTHSSPKVKTRNVWLCIPFLQYLQHTFAILYQACTVTSFVFFFLLLLCMISPFRFFLRRWNTTESPLLHCVLGYCLVRLRNLEDRMFLQTHEFSLLPPSSIKVSKSFLVSAM